MVNEMKKGCVPFIKEWIKENKEFVIFLFGMSLYYGWRMFTLDPWYDELYTYYSFISRGPVYAAIHWPVPNNHVFYSVLSAFLTVFGNPYLSLRGISCLAAIGNLLLLYIFAKKFMNKWFSLGCTALYSSFYLVNSLSIQGRGYTLAIGFYLSALLMLYEICVKQKERLTYYVIFSLSLTWGLYTITSNLYWVLSVCLAGGFYLLLQKEGKRLAKLIVSSLIAALHTFGLYSIIWLAIGSNLLSKTENSGFYGIYQVTIILQAPFQAWKRGLDYMLASPYIQSKDRGIVISSFFSWTRGLMDLFVSRMGGLLTVVLVLSWFFCIVLAGKAYRSKEKEKLFLFLYFTATLFATPVILIIQSVQPYYRVFTFLGVFLSLLIISYLAEGMKKDRAKIVCTGCMVFACVQLFSPFYNAPYADREIQIKELWEKSGIQQSPESMCFLDDYQKYVLHFYWGYQLAQTDLKEAEYIMLPKEIMNPEYTIKNWPVLYSYEEIDWNYLNTCNIIEETESYLLYKKLN